jgi:hypothetical protein
MNTTLLRHVGSAPFIRQQALTALTLSKETSLQQQGLKALAVVMVIYLLCSFNDAFNGFDYTMSNNNGK